VAQTPNGVRRRGRPACESAARGSQGEGRKGRFAREGPTARGPTGAGQSRRAGPGESLRARARHGAGARDAGATALTGTFPISAYPPLTNNYSNF
jgi:hypothetical protein